ncbi:MAG: hypothetical protein JSV51_04360 [Candidatus Bathyarchaeota archaeon]|nr:MAG: hypothetical protein JSV51_04360 [Candidatus Bathyarchaeota archaeon]
MKHSSKIRKLRVFGSLRREISGLLGFRRAYGLPQASVGFHKEKYAPKDRARYYSNFSPIETALLEVEHKKAKALMEVERQRMRML